MFGQKQRLLVVFQFWKANEEIFIDDEADLDLAERIIDFKLGEKTDYVTAYFYIEQVITAKARSK